MPQPLSLTIDDPERSLEYEFVRATESAALNCLQWLGRGEKELADAINGVFDLVDTGKKAITHSILMRARSRALRYIRAVHHLETKTIHLRSVQR